MASNNVAPFAKIAGNATDVYVYINKLLLLYVRIDAAVFANAAVPGVVRPLTEHVKILRLKASEVTNVSTKFGEV